MEPLVLSALPPEFFEAMLQGVSDGISITENGKVIYANERLGAMAGMRASEMIGSTPRDYVIPESVDDVQGAVLSNEERSYSATAVRRDGSRIHVEIRSIPFVWAGRSLRLAILRNRTEAYEAEQSVRASKELFEAIFEQAAVGIAHIGADRKVLRINRRFCGILGRSPSELAGRELIDFVCADDARRIAETYAGEGNLSRDARFKRGDGSLVWIQLTTSPLRGQNGELKYFVTIAQDISEKKVAEENLLEHRMRLFAASKMSALGEMASGMAHEINNPLAIIRSYAGLVRDALRSGNRPVEQIISSVEKIDSTVVRISKIISSLRGFARDCEQDPFVAVPVGVIVQETLEICEARFRREGVEVRCASVPAALRVECRSVQLAQVLLNLLNNACDAVMASGKERSERWIALSVEDLGDHLEIRVDDSGAGVLPEVRDRIMQPFFTTKQAGKGVGLGLSISRKIVENHDGTLTLDLGVAHTRFVVSLPKVQRPD